MSKPLFTGVCTAMVTPFLGGRINYPMLQILLRRQTEAAIPAVVIAGTTGESATLTDKEKIALFHTCREYINNTCLFIAGTGSNDTAHAVALSLAAEEAGADALLVVTPYYNKATAGGIIAHYAAIADAVNIPIIVYNVPSRTGVDIATDTYVQLSRLPHIAGVKEAGNDIVKILQIRQACPDHFRIWTGNDDHTAAAINMGADGVISVASNLFPMHMQKLVQYALNGQRDDALYMQKTILPLCKQLFCEVNPIPVKEGMKLLGYDCGPCRLPLTPLSAECRLALQQICQELDRAII